jgi:hypothetical protein
MAFQTKDALLEATVENLRKQLLTADNAAKTWEAHITTKVDYDSKGEAVLHVFTTRRGINYKHSFEKSFLDRFDGDKLSLCQEIVRHVMQDVFSELLVSRVFDSVSLSVDSIASTESKRR